MRPSDLQRLYAIFTLLGVAGFLWCAFHHVCCGGHMAHPPYPASHYLFDFLWVLSFVIAAMLGGQRERRHVLGPTLMGILTASRFLTGSLSGFALLIEFPLVLVIVALALWAGVESFWIVDTDD